MQAASIIYLVVSLILAGRIFSLGNAGFLGSLFLGFFFAFGGFAAVTALLLLLGAALGRF